MNIILFGSFLVLLMGCVVIFFVLLYQKKKQQAAVQQQLLRSQFQQELLGAQLEIQEQTLKNISEEIHDNIGQVLSLAKLNLNTLSSPQQQKLEDARYLLGKAITDLRDLSRSLHGEKIAETGLVTALEHELRILQNTGKLKAELQVSGQPIPFDAQTDTILFRIVQEALHNAVKHAQANTCTVQLQYTPQQFTLTITDDGRGFDPDKLKAAETGIGLKNMRNRAALIGASFQIRTAAGRGTAIMIVKQTGG